MEILEYMKLKLGCNYISDLKKEEFLEKILVILYIDKRHFSDEQIDYLLDYIGYNKS